MTERECQARLHPHTGHVEVSPQLARERNEALDVLIEQATLRTKRMLIAERKNTIYERSLNAIAENKTLEGSEALRALELAETAGQPVPNLRPTYDHAGPDY